VTLRATAFHARVAAANRCNAWQTRNGYTLAAAYGDAQDEVLAARSCAALIDISWHWRLLFEGARAAECLSRICTRDVSALVPGAHTEIAWLDDRGLVRGAGRVERLGRERFRLVAAAPDDCWMARAAALFEVATRDVTGQAAGLALCGPLAPAAVAAAGIATRVSAHGLQRLVWNAREIEILGTPSGFEIRCAADDALFLWDCMVRAGQDFALLPMGLQAQDMLAVGRGVVQPGIDYRPGQEPPEALGLGQLVATGHKRFNGRSALLARPAGPILMGISLDSPEPAPRAPVSFEGRDVGRTLSSTVSPLLGHAIALAKIEAGAAVAGRRVLVSATEGMLTPLPFLQDAGVAFAEASPSV
jgi:glycine cleavage system aminomethyltransferase T